MDRLIPKRRFNVKHLVAGCAVAVVLTAAAMVGSRILNPSISTAGLSFAVVSSDNLLVAVRGYGTVNALGQLLMSAPISTSVESIPVSVGSAVAAGELLLRLSKFPTTQPLNQAKAGLQRAVSAMNEARFNAELDGVQNEQALATLVAQERLAERELQAKRGLGYEGVVAKLDIERLAAALAAIKSQARAQEAKSKAMIRINAARISTLTSEVELQQAGIKALERDAAALDVRAPSKGIVEEIAVVPGQSVAAGERLIRLVSPENLIAEIRVPQGESSRISVGNSAKLTLEGNTYAARVDRVDASIRENTVLLFVKPQRPFPERTRIGQALIAEVQPTTGEPSRIMTNVGKWKGNTMEDAYVLRDGKLFRRSVRFGSEIADRIVVLDGVHEGDKVFVATKALLALGSEISVDEQ